MRTIIRTEPLACPCIYPCLAPLPSPFHVCAQLLKPWFARGQHLFAKPGASAVCPQWQDSLRYIVGRPAAELEQAQAVLRAEVVTGMGGAHSDVLVRVLVFFREAIQDVLGQRSLPG